MVSPNKAHLINTVVTFYFFHLIVIIAVHIYFFFPSYHLRRISLQNFEYFHSVFSPCYHHKFFILLLTFLITFFQIFFLFFFNFSFIFHVYFYFHFHFMIPHFIYIMFINLLLSLIFFPPL